MENKKIRKNPEIPFKTKYAQIRDHLDYFLGQALEDIYAPLPLEQIKERLQAVTEINLSVRTIQQDLKKFSKKYGENLLCQVGDRFRLNHCLYKYINVKPPRGYSKD
ncbi:MAG: hypothetical protein OEW87_12560 [Flavobacteriaceae bacterium]|nr:hypothetical protein [Flavobacteriaceae bacterium]